MKKFSIGGMVPVLSVSLLPKSTYALQTIDHLWMNNNNSFFDVVKEKVSPSSNYEIYIVIILACLIRVVWSTISSIRKEKKTSKKSSKKK